MHPRKWTFVQKSGGHSICHAVGEFHALGFGYTLTASNRYPDQQHCEYYQMYNGTNISRQPLHIFVLECNQYKQVQASANAILWQTGWDTCYHWLSAVLTLVHPWHYRFTGRCQCNTWEIFGFTFKPHLAHRITAICAIKHHARRFTSAQTAQMLLKGTARGNKDI